MEKSMLMELLILTDLFMLTAVMLFSSCTKNDTIALPITAVEIVVKDGNSWNATTTTMQIVKGAIIKIYDSATDILNNIPPKYIMVTGNGGRASMLVEYKSKYFFTVEKWNATNIIAGLLVTGIFQSQTEIDASPLQIPFPAIGSPKFLDTNGDGKITSPEDNVTADYIDLIKDQTATKTSIIYQ